MSDRSSETFDLIGDPDNLPDAFFEALAALLCDLDPRPGVGPASTDEGTSEPSAMNASVS